MSGYPLVWLRGWLLLGTAGACLALLLWPPRTALTAIVAVVLTTAGCYAWAQRRSPDRVVLGRYGAPRHELVAAMGLGLVGLRAVGEVSQSGVFWVLVVLVVSHPGVLARVHGLVPVGPSLATVATTAITGVAGGPPATTPVGSLTTAELCEAWRASSRLLALARSPQDMQRAVALRQTYLDEMGRRDPTGLSAWLESGARPTGGSPERYLRDWRVTGGE